MATFDANLGQRQTNAGGSTITLTTAAAAAAGSRILVAVGCQLTSPSAIDVQSVTGGGLVFAKTTARALSSNGANLLCIFDAPAPSGLASGTVLTATFTAAPNTIGDICAASFLGVNGSAEVAKGTSQAASANWSDTITTTNPVDVVWTVVQTDSSTATTSVTTAGTEIHDSWVTGRNRGITSAYLLPTSAGSQTISGTWSGLTGQSYNLTLTVAIRDQDTFPPPQPIRPLMLALRQFRPGSSPFPFAWPTPNTAPDVVVGGGTVFPQPLTASLTISALFQNQANKNLTATTVATPNLQKQAGKLLTATSALTATIQRQTNKLLTVTSTLVASVLRKVLKPLSATSTTTASFTKTVVHAMSATLTTSPTLSKTALKALSATSTLSASVQKTTQKLLTASLTASASLALLKVAQVFLTATTTASASMVKLASKSFTTTVGLSSSFKKTVLKNLSVSVSSSPSLSAIKSILVTLSTTVTTSASMLTPKLAIKALTATVITTAQISRKTLKSLTVSIAPTAVLLKKRFMTLTASVTTSASLATSFIAAGAVTAVKRVANIIIGRF